MRRFIYLDTDTLNSYLAQIYDGLIQNRETEISKSKKKERQNRLEGTLAGQIAFKLFGKGIDATAEATYEHIKAIADDEMVRDVQSKIMHDNAYEQFMEYLQKNNLFENRNIGNFVSLVDDFYIFDIDFYKRLFDDDEFVSFLKEIQNMNIQKAAEQKFEELSRDSRRNKGVKEEFSKRIQETIDKGHEGIDAIKKMVNMLAAIIPYPQMLCISNYAVVLDEKYLRDDLSRAAFKYGGKIHVVGYITNKITAQANSPISAFSGIGDFINTLVKIFFENADETFIVHPVAIYYED